MPFLLKILGKQIWMYLFSSLLFIIVIFFRTLEPKVFQWLTDCMISFKNSGGTSLSVPIQIPFVNHILFNHPNLVAILLYYAFLYLVITLMRSLLVFTANIINASSTELALYKVRNQLFDHMQRLSYQHYVIH